MAEESKQTSAAGTYLDALDKSKGSNRDTGGLGVLSNGLFAIGAVDEINGPGGEEVEFPVTRYELEQLAAFWWTERIDHDWDFFVTQSTGSSEWRRSVYIGRRLHRLEEVLGEETMGKVFEKTVARWRERYKVSDEDWRVFAKGTDAEQDAWLAKNYPLLWGEEPPVTPAEARILAESFGAQDAAVHESATRHNPKYSAGKLARKDITWDLE